jgi:hypothetical protein
MKNKHINPVLVILLIILFSSCASHSLCPAYSTIDKGNIDIDRSSLYHIKSIESKGLEEITKNS